MWMGWIISAGYVSICVPAFFESGERVPLEALLRHTGQEGPIWNCGICTTRKEDPPG